MFFDNFLAKCWLLLFGHALADYVWQTETMGHFKNPWESRPPEKLGPWWWHLGAHGLINGGLVTVITGSVLYGVLECLIHMGTDLWKCHQVHIHPHRTRTWTWIDQGIHLACKGVWAWLASR